MAASIFQQRKKNELPFYLILICCEKEYRFCIISKSLLYGMGNGDKLNVFLRALYLYYLRLIEKDYRTISTNFFNLLALIWKCHTIFSKDLLKNKHVIAISSFAFLFNPIYFKSWTLLISFNSISNSFMQSLKK